MANALETLLNQTLPRFLGNELANVRADAKYEIEQEQERLRYQKEWNREENRYQDRVDRQNTLDDRQFDASLIQTGLGIRNLKDQKEYFKDLEDNNKYRSDESLNLITARTNLLTNQIESAETNVKSLTAMGIENYYTNAARNFYMQGNDVAAFNVIDNQLKNKFKNPQTQAQAQLYMANIKRDSDALNSLKGVQGKEFDDERRRLESSIRQNTNKFRKLYELPTPFDPDSLQNQFSSFVKTGLSTAGVDVGKSGSKEFERIFGAGGDYSELFQNYEDEFISGPNAADQSPEDRQAAMDNVVKTIIEKEQGGKPPEDDGFPNMVPTVGQVGAGFLAWQIAKDPAKQAGKFLTDKSIAASKHIKFVSGLPADDVVKFLDQMGSDTPGKPGTMMKKVEKIMTNIEELSGEKKDAKNKAKMAKLNQQLDDQILKVKNRLRKLGVSDKMKDADIDKLLRNPNKWRLAGVKRKMRLMQPKAGRAIRGWGVFSASQKIGEALGDPTGGVATGLTVGGATKTVESLIKKKGSKWAMKRLVPFIGQSAAKRIVGGAVTGTAALPGWGTAAFTVGGAGLTIYDIYKYLTEEE